MLVLGKNILAVYMVAHADVRGVLGSWLAEAESTQWTTPQDIKARYRSADILPENRVIFNIGGNKHRLVVKVKYSHGTVLVEWIGTHAEYSKKKW